MGRYDELHKNNSIVLQEVRTLISKSKKVHESVSNLKEDTNYVYVSNEFTGKILEYVNQQWKDLGDARTAVLETIPLLFAINPTISTPADVSSLLSQDYDWHPKAKDWFSKFFKGLEKVTSKSVESTKEKLSKVMKIKGKDNEKEEYDKLISSLGNSGFKYFTKVICEGKVLGGGSSLNDIAGKFDRFIHSKIEDFYGSFGRAAMKGGSKKFTADVILVYGNSSVNDLINKKELTKDYTVSPSNDMLVDLSDGKTKLSFVSLKAQGRIGKVGSLGTIFDRYAKQLDEQEIQEDSSNNQKKPIEESFFSSVADAIDSAKSLGKKGLDKLESYWGKSKSWFIDWIQSIKKMGQDFISFSKAEATSQEKASQRIEKMMKELDQFNQIDESSDMDEDISLTTCFQEQLKQLGKDLKIDNDPNFSKIKSKFDSLGKNLSKYENDKIFRFSYPGLKQKLITSEQTLDNLRTLYNAIISAKPVSSPKRVGSCTEIKIAKKIKVSRNTIKEFLWQYSNVKAIPVIEYFVNDIYQKATQKYQNSEDIRAYVIKMCTEINAEAVFGNSGDLPLVKFDTGKILRLGQRDKYIEKKTQSLSKTFKSENTPPVVAVRICQTSAKNLQGDPYAFFQISMFILSDVDVEDTNINEIPNSAFTYGSINFKNNQGTQFVFVQEVDAQRDGDSLMKLLSSPCASS